MWNNLSNVQIMFYFIDKISVKSICWQKEQAQLEINSIIFPHSVNQQISMRREFNKETNKNQNSDTHAHHTLESVWENGLEVL